MPAITLIDAMQPHVVLGGVVDEVNKSAPELGFFPIQRLTNGLHFTSQFMVELPKFGFRRFGNGVDATKGRYEERTFKIFPFSGRLEVENAAGQAHNTGLEGLKAREVVAGARAAGIELAEQIWYGVSNEADGFPGLKAFTPFGGAYTLNAGGTTAGTASSVYGVKVGEDFIEMLIGGQGDPMMLGDWRPETLTGANGKSIEGQVASLEGFAGLAVRHKASVVRICNLTADSGKGMTSNLAYEALSLLPANQGIDAWFMSRRSLEQLRKSFITNENKEPANPTTLAGYPIIVTDNILNTDTIET